MFAVLSKEDILKRLQARPPLIDSILNIERQVQPNGVDLTLKEVALLSSAGRLGQADDTRILSKTSPLPFDASGDIALSPGCYMVTYNEIVNLSRDVMALAMPRSSLLRCGVSVHTAVWDAGYSGRSQSLLVVYNPHGFSLHRDARIIQLVFFQLSQETGEGYTGRFQTENM